MTRQEMEDAFDNWRGALMGAPQTVPSYFAWAILTTGETAFREMWARDEELTALRAAVAETTERLARYETHINYLVDQLALRDGGDRPLEDA